MYLFKIISIHEDLTLNRNKSCLLFSSAEMFKKRLWQTVWTQIRLVCSWSTLFASILNSSVMLGNYLQQTTSADDIFRCIFFLALKGLKYIYILYAGIFLGLIWDRVSAPSQFKNEQKLPKMVYIIPNFLVLQFDENFMKMKLVPVVPYL